MRCPEGLRAFALAALLGLPLVAQAGAEAVRAAIAARLQQQLPALSPGEYPLGSAVFDAQLRAKVEEGNAGVPSSGAVEAGRGLWTRKFRDGRTLASCFPNGGRRIAASYPQYDTRLKRVVTLEMAINQCLKTHGETLFDPADPETMGAATAYARSLSDGRRIAVRVPAAGEDRFEQGRRLYFTRLGQQNYACASCHIQGAGKRFADQPISPVIGQATHWPVIRDGRAITLQARMRECLELMGAAPFAAGSDELNHLEYFLTYLSNGLVLKANAWRSR